MFYINILIIRGLIIGKLNDYFKNILNDNHEKSNSKLEFKLSDHVKIENKSNKKIDEQVLKSEDISIDDNSERIQELYDGYIGEKNFIPNPYEYGPNATYRNVNEGIVYKKNDQNLWETYRDWETDRKSTRLNSSHSAKSRMPSSA